MRKGAMGSKVHHEKKSDGMTDDHGKKTNGVRVHHKKKEQWNESSP